MTDVSMDQLLADLATARTLYDEAQKAESIARNECCTALNRLNAAQKAVSARMMALMKDAPRESNWAQERMAKRAAEPVERVQPAPGITG